MFVRKKFDAKKAFDVKNPTWWKRCIFMMVAICVQGLGACLFMMSQLGNDPCYASVLSFSDKFGPNYQWLVDGLNSIPVIGLLKFTTRSFATIALNTLIFIVVELIFSPELIGFGTIFNWVMFSIFADRWLELLSPHLNVENSYIGMFIVMLLGVLVQSFGCAFYQTAKMGVAPYDALSLTLESRTKIPYFWCRIIFDLIFAVFALLLGGFGSHISLGTIVSVFGMGPFISFFTKNLAEKVIPKAE